MGKTYHALDEELQQWIAAQHMFVVATAPLATEGHINCSPKGGDCFRVLGSHEVAYLDYTGSGIETVAHLRENGRITIMFSAFTGPPKILRIYGRGEAILPDDRRFAALAAHFPSNPGTRSIIRVEVDRIADACGFAVPTYTFENDRKVLDDWATQKGPAGVQTYQSTRNAVSIDGLPGLARSAGQGSS